jgi:hypothetical protein
MIDTAKKLTALDIAIYNLKSLAVGENKRMLSRDSPVIEDDIIFLCPMVKVLPGCTAFCQTRPVGSVIVIIAFKLIVIVIGKP